MTDLTPERRDKMRRAVTECTIPMGSTIWPVGGTTFLALLDAADERDRLAAAVERVRALADNWERLDRALLAAGAAGMSMPAVDAVRQLRERLSALDGTDE